MPNLETTINKINSVHGALFILCGYPYAGKSYIARQLLSKTDAAYVSIDDIFHGRGFDWNSEKLPSTEEWEGIFNESYAKMKELLREGKNVLYDSTNHTVASREKLREVAKSVGAEASVIYVQTSIEKVWERWAESKRNRHRPVVSRELVQATIESFELPTPDERVFVVPN